IGIAAGLLLRGRLEGLASLEFRWAPVLLAALLVQIILFSGPVSERIGPAGPPLYVLSTGIALGAILRNWRTRGIPLVALGAGRDSRRRRARCCHHRLRSSSPRHDGPVGSGVALRRGDRDCPPRRHPRADGGPRNAVPARGAIRGRSPSDPRAGGACPNRREGDPPG